MGFSCGISLWDSPFRVLAQSSPGQTPREKEQTGKEKDWNERGYLDIYFPVIIVVLAE